VSFDRADRFNNGRDKFESRVEKPNSDAAYLMDDDPEIRIN